MPRDWLPLYRTLLVAQEIDRVEEELVRQGHAFFQVSATGHEATAALAWHLTPDDYLHLHYRDKALLLARGVPIRDFFLNLLCRSGSHSSGRRMNAFFSARRLNVLSMVTPVGNNALQAVGVASAVKSCPTNPIVVCSIGDGGSQEGEFMEAVAEAARESAPVLFLVEDNGWAISTRTTGKTFFSTLRDGELFLGMRVAFIDGKSVPRMSEDLGRIVHLVREERVPAIVVCHVERMCDHTSTDDQNRYRNRVETARLAEGDPVALFERFLRSGGVADDVFVRMKREAANTVRQAAAEALAAPEPTPAFDAKRPVALGVTESNDMASSANSTSVTLREAINAVLRHRLATDERVFLLGQDIEDPKGDVFGVTKSLSTDYPGRVRNAALSESTIVGTCIGRALTGQRPVAFIQFADFMTLAFNQITSELASMYWRTCGEWECPVIVMLPCGGYRPGLDPFHSQTMESIAAHIPGVDVVMPSTAADAAGLMNAIFESGRPTLFFYPKALLNSGDVSSRIDARSHMVPLGKAKLRRHGNDLSVVSWGAAIQECQKAIDDLEQAGVGVDLVDLRSLSPWDSDAVLESVARTRRLLIVHEDNSTCGFGAEVAATVAEKFNEYVAIRRVARPDTYIPCHFPSQQAVLPSWKRILETATDMLGLLLSWMPVQQDTDSLISICAIGSGPADDLVEVLSVQVVVGEQIKIGQVVAEIEAAKSVVDVMSGVEGIVAAIVVQKGDRVRVGSALIKVIAETKATSAARVQFRPVVVREESRNGAVATRSTCM